MINPKILLAVVLPIVLVVGGSGYYFASDSPSSQNNSQISVQEIWVDNRTAVYHNPQYSHNSYADSEYDNIISYWYNLWRHNNYYNFTEELVYKGKKYADISASVYLQDYCFSLDYNYLVNFTYHGHIGNLVKFTMGYTGYNLPEVEEYESSTDMSFEAGPPLSGPGVISLDENKTVNYTAYIQDDGIYLTTPNSFYTLLGPWDNLTYNITTSAKNLKIFTKEYFSSDWVSPNTTLSYLRAPAKLSFWIKDGNKILEFSMGFTIKVPLIFYGLALPEPKVNITKIGERSVKLDIEPTSNYTNIYVFWMDGNRTITRSKVVWHNYTKPGKYPIMVFYSYKGNGSFYFYSLSHTLWKLHFDRFELSRIWNFYPRVEVSINA